MSFSFRSLFYFHKKTTAFNATLGILSPLNVPHQGIRRNWVRVSSNHNIDIGYNWTLGSPGAVSTHVFQKACPEMAEWTVCVLCARSVKDAGPAWGLHSLSRAADVWRQMRLLYPLHLQIPPGPILLLGKVPMCQFSLQRLTVKGGKVQWKRVNTEHCKSWSYHRVMKSVTNSRAHLFITYHWIQHWKTDTWHKKAGKPCGSVFLSLRDRHLFALGSLLQ